MKYLLIGLISLISLNTFAEGISYPYEGELVIQIGSGNEAEQRAIKNAKLKGLENCQDFIEEGEVCVYTDVKVVHHRNLITAQALFEIKPLE